MDASLINPFIKATLNVISTMSNINPKAGKPTVKTSSDAWGIVTGVIGMAGQDVMGNLVISFDEASILEIVSAMLMENFQDINQDVVDAVGEITNMICGGAKKDLSELGLHIEMATPVMMIGKGLELAQFSKAPVISLQFLTQKGAFVVESNLSRRS
jgi:chemotaxis protein CheX